MESKQNCNCIGGSTAKALGILVWVLVLGVLAGASPAAAVCGDGFLDAGEQCDDGNTFPGDGCDASCQMDNCQTDTGGVNQANVGGGTAQGDLTQFCVSPGATNEDYELHSKWNWDNIAQSGANSADACTLYTTDSDGNANLAACVSAGDNPLTQLAICVGGDEAGQPCNLDDLSDALTVACVDGGGACYIDDSPRFFLCGNDRPDRCTENDLQINTCGIESNAPSCLTDADCVAFEDPDPCGVGVCVNGGVRTNQGCLADTDCGTGETCDLGTAGSTIGGGYATECDVSQTTDDPFPEGTASPNDTEAICFVDLDDFDEANAILVDACSYSSRQANSAPNDCVLAIGCKLDEECDDSNECTLDVCDTDIGVCRFTPDTGAECEEGDLCLEGAFCTDQGFCDTTNQSSVDCDDSNECTDDTCEPSTGCVWTNNDNNICGDQSSSTCDAPDSCVSGFCQPNYAGTGVLCRGDAGECDVPEYCDGAGSCPADGFEPGGTSCGDTSDTVCTDPDTCDDSGACQDNHEPITTECRADAGDCDVPESCNADGTCPADGFEPGGTSCGDTSDTVCTDPDTCDDSGACQDNHEPITTECRADAGDCDVPESCNADGTCPADGFEPGGTSCGDTSDTVCTDPDTCDDSGACQDNHEPITTECRADAGDCDVPESCNADGTCPADGFEPGGTSCGDTSDTVCTDPDTCDDSGACQDNHEPITTECRADAGDCDVPESCNADGTCPADGFEPGGTSCGDTSDTVCTDPDTCDDSGACQDNHEPITTECRADAGDCDVPESCNADGTCPADGFEPGGTSCGDTSDTVCTDPDTCDDSGACQDNHEPITTECRADAGDCDVPESCNADGTCPADGFEPGGTSCGDTSDTVCTDPDTCDDSGACQDNHEPITTECRADAGDCDVPESCNADGTCPADGFEPGGTSCGDTSDTVCTDPDTCDDSGACQDNHEPITTECRADAGDCDVPESCNADGTCPADGFEPGGTSCGDTSDTVCTDPDTCDDSGACQDNHEPITTECRADAGDCDVPESCNADGTCPADGFEPGGTSCGDTSDTVCTDPDTCDDSGACQDNHEPITTECRADAGDCDVPESCNADGTCPADGFEPGGTSCGDTSDTVCTDPDTCDDSGACQDNHEPITTECRADAGDCDVPESCNADGTCPADGFEPGGTSCGDTSDTVCTDPDTCDDSGACQDNHEPITTECRADAGDCDVPESCNADGTCPADGFEPGGTSCGDTSDTVCTDPDTCDDSGACQDNHEPITTECRADAGDCDVPESCNADGTCPADGFEPEGTACGSNADTACTNPDTCDGLGECDSNNTPCGGVTDSSLCFFDVQPDKGICTESRVACEFPAACGPDPDLTCRNGSCFNADGVDLGILCDDPCVGDSDWCEQTGQFRLLYTPDVQNFPAYKLPASNPGQTFYNLIVEGTPAAKVDLEITIPYPYVTVGGQSVHVYPDSTTIGACVDSSGSPADPPVPCYTGDVANCAPEDCDENCFAPGAALQQYDAQWTIEDWVAGNDPVDDLVEWSVLCDAICGPAGEGTCVLTLEDVEIPASGAAYVNIHLDYGLKGNHLDANPCDDGLVDRYDPGDASTGFTEVGFDALVDTADQPPTGALAIADCTDYRFSHFDGSETFGDSVQNLNAFKPIAGSFGRCTHENNGKPCNPELLVELIRSDSGEVVQSGLTDEDGFWVTPYKHRGKPASYTVLIWEDSKCGIIGQEIELQGNGWANVVFDASTCTATAQYGKGRNKNNGDKEASLKR